MKIVREVVFDFIDWEFLATICGLVGPRMSDGRYYAEPLQ